MNAASVAHAPAARPRRTPSSVLRRTAFWLAVAAIVVWSLGPFLWQVVASLQPDRELLRSTPKFLPVPPTGDHFSNAFEVKQFHRYIINSVIVVGATTVLSLIIASCAAYGLARFKMPGRMAILGVILGISMFPQIALVAPLYLVMGNLGLLDTYRGLIGVYVSFGLPLMVWVLFGHFRQIPRELDEAAKIDGAGTLRILVSVIAPMAMPGVVTAGLLGFIAAWNEFMFALAFTTSIDHQTIPVGIANFTELYYIPWGDVAAASVVVTVPLVILVLIFQRRIVAGLTQGAVKE
jgi:multiple sugar transport system permease protein/trehalose/maltose transport system permease protein